MARMMDIPLWDNTIFQTDTGVRYRCPKLMRLGVYQVADMIENGGVDRQKVQMLAPTWRGQYQQKLEFMLRQRDAGKESVVIRGKEVPMTQWKLNRVARAMAEANAPEERQNPQVWEALGILRVPWRLQSFIWLALWKKLPVNARLAEKEIKDMDKCPLCQVKEDHGHRLKKVPNARHSVPDDQGNVL